MKITPALLAGVLALTVLGTPLGGHAQPAARVGILFGSSPPPTAAFLDALKSGLRELGYAENRTIVYEPRWAEGRTERFTEFAEEFKRSGIDVVIAAGPVQTRVAREALPTTPIVMVGVAAPVRLGLVSSLSRPSGNITGLATLAPEGFLGKQLALLKEAVPHASRLAALINPANALHITGIELDSARTATSLGVDLLVLRAPNAAEVDAAFATIRANPPHGLHVVADALFITQRARVLRLATELRLPTMHLYRDDAEAGALLAYGPDIRQMWRRAAWYVDRILKGTKPAELPVEQPTKFELVINLKTAKALGLTIPRSLLLRADQVIE